MDKTIPAPAALLLDFIAKPESDGNYNAVFGNGDNKVPLSQWSVDDLLAKKHLHLAKKGQTAAGRYQIINKTLRGLKKKMGLTGGEKFTPDLQDRMALQLLKDRGYDGFAAGRLALGSFALNLAKEWASLPLLRAANGNSRGESYYAGDGLNKAHIKPEALEAVLTKALALAGRTAPEKIIDEGMAEMAKERTRQFAEEKLERYEVEAIQRRLRELGYFQVGKVDGIWGPSTRAAITALQTQVHDGVSGKPGDASVVIDGHWGPQTKALLADDANKRHVSEARANTTASDLAAQGSAIVIGGRRITVAAVLNAIVMAAGVIVTVAQSYDPTASLPFPFSLVTAFLPPWALPLAGLGFAVYNALKAHGVIRARVEAERSGLHNGEPEPSPVQHPSGGLLGNLFGGLFGQRTPQRAGA